MEPRFVDLKSTQRPHVLPYFCLASGSSPTSSHELGNKLPEQFDLEILQTLQIYEVLLESWKDPLGVEEFFDRQEENGQNLTFFWEPSVQLMVFLNEEKQSLPVGPRQAVDTVLSLLVNESFLKKNLDERRAQIVQVVDSFALPPDEKSQLDEFSEAVRVKASSLYGPKVYKDLIKQF